MIVNRRSAAFGEPGRQDRFTTIVLTFPIQESMKIEPVRSSQDGQNQPAK